jgi:hypothetical protein
VGQLLETCINPSPGIRVILRVDIYDLLKKSNTWSGYIRGYRKFKYPVLIYNFGAHFFFGKSQISM